MPNENGLPCHKMCNYSLWAECEYRVSFAPLLPLDLVNFCGVGQGFFSTGWGRRTSLVYMLARVVCGTFFLQNFKWAFAVYPAFQRGLCSDEVCIE